MYQRTALTQISAIGTETNMTDLGALEKAAKVATAGPWRQHLVDDTVVVGKSNIEICNCWPAGGEDDDADFNADTEQHEKDASFIALANPSAILALIADQRALLAKVERYEKALTEIAKQKRSDEFMTVTDVKYADFEQGHDDCIATARTALGGAHE